MSLRLLPLTTLPKIDDVIGSVVVAIINVIIVAVIVNIPITTLAAGTA